MPSLNKRTQSFRDTHQNIYRKIIQGLSWGLRSEMYYKWNYDYYELILKLDVEYMVILYNIFLLPKLCAFYIKKKKCLQSWKDCLAVERADCRSRGSIPAPTPGLPTICNSGPRESDTLFWAGMHRHICRQNTHIHKINTILKLKKACL